MFCRMQFVVGFERRRRKVNLAFGKPADIPGLMRWRVPAFADEHAPIRDAIEFRKLATKRWRYYRKGNEAASSLKDLRGRIQANCFAEVGFLLVAKAAWHPSAPILGCCFCRRSWCHHLIIDFLAVHPKVLAQVGGRVRGVGTGIMYSLVRLADDLGVGTIWGEATQGSAQFYEKVLGLRRVTDHFFVQGPTLEHCRRHYKQIAG
jgi:hypothetical protein